MKETITNCLGMLNEIEDCHDCECNIVIDEVTDKLETIYSYMEHLDDNLSELLQNCFHEVKNNNLLKDEIKNLLFKQFNIMV